MPLFVQTSNPVSPSLKKPLMCLVLGHATPTQKPTIQNATGKIIIIIMVPAISTSYLLKAYGGDNLMLAFYGFHFTVYTK